MSVGTRLGIQLIIGVIHRSAIVTAKLCLIHVVTKRRLRTIKRIILTVPRKTQKMPVKNPKLLCQPLPETSSSLKFYCFVQTEIKFKVQQVACMNRDKCLLRLGKC